MSGSWSSGWAPTPSSDGVSITTGRRSPTGSCASVRLSWPSHACASPPSSPAGRCARPPGQASDEVELYHRTYTTLLRSSGETLLRVLEPSHARDELEPARARARHGAARPRRVPVRAAAPAGRRSGRRNVIVVGQESEAFARAGDRPDRGLGAARGARPAAPLVRLRRRARSPSCSPPPRTSTTRSRRSSPTSSSGTSCTRCCAPPSCPHGARAARRRRGARRHRGGLDADARVLARRARAAFVDEVARRAS